MNMTESHDLDAEYVAADARRREIVDRAADSVDACRQACIRLAEESDRAVDRCMNNGLSTAQVCKSAAGDLITAARLIIDAAVAADAITARTAADLHGVVNFAADTAKKIDANLRTLEAFNAGALRECRDRLSPAAAAD